MSIRKKIGLITLTATLALSSMGICSAAAIPSVLD